MIGLTVSERQAVHLHVHSEYSLLDGANKIPQMAKRCADLGMPALGLTDHGVLNGAVEHYKECKKNGIKPIIGVEAYFVDDHTDRSRKFEQNHLTLLASSDEGFRNIVKLTSDGFLKGFKRNKPTVDMSLLEAYSNGLICLTGCLQSRFARRIVDGREKAARSHADELMRVFGAENLYFEVQKNAISDQDKVNEVATKIARDVGRPIVGTADVHYLRKEDYRDHAALLCVQTKSTLEDPKITFDTNEFYLKSPDEMAADYADTPEAVASTIEIADRCKVEIELGKLLLPAYPCPEGKTATDYLRELVLVGVNEMYGDPTPAEVNERVEYELSVISEMGYESYFLMVWDFVRFAKDSGIAVGPGRGSAAGSIVSYCLKVTDVDPLKYDLLFERFLNPARKSMPDIDIDFSTTGRDAVIKYVSDKYGKDSVAQIITFGRMAPKAATRDAGRVLGHPYSDVDRIAKLIPDPIMGRNPTFKECLKPREPLKLAYDSESQAKEIVDVATGLEGIVRNSSIHAAAVVIADRPLTEIVPLQLAEDREVRDENGDRTFRTVTQYSMGPIEEIGLLKMDFLGLRNLDVLESAAGVIERSTGEKIDIEKLPLDDSKTYRMLTRGDSIGVFQMESEGMREALKRIKPTEFEDLIALVALYRPGPMRFIPDYAKGKSYPDSVTHIDDRLMPITGPTYGIAIYQEQLMEIAKQIAGFSGAESDDLRKAIGKKKRDLMKSMKEKFYEGCRASSTSDHVVRELWSLMEAAADYSFNKSHAACYALIAYRTAYLKANFPAEYMAALISSVMNTKDKVPFLVSRCEGMDIKVLPPDVNSSSHDFVVIEGDVRFGLDAVKNVGYAAVEKIIQARESGDPFSSLWDFCNRVEGQAVNKRALESLIKCGALDSTGGSRKGMLEAVETALKIGQQVRADALAGQESLLGDEIDGGNELSTPTISEDEFEKAVMLRMEKEAVGLFITSHPLADMQRALRSQTDCLVSGLDVKADGDWATVGGLIIEAKALRTKKGDPMMFATLDDMSGTVEMLIFNSDYAAGENKLEVDQVAIVKGRIDHKNRGETKLVVQNLKVVSEEELKASSVGSGRDAGTGEIESVQNWNQNGGSASLVLRAELENLALEETIDGLKGALSHFPGNREVVLELYAGGTARTFKFGDDFKVQLTNGLRAEVESVLGPGVLK